MSERAFPPTYHFIKLGVWGGLERVFEALWSHQDGFRRVINLDGSVHALLAETLGGAEVLPYKRWGRWPLPKHPSGVRHSALRRRTAGGPQPAIALLWDLLGLNYPRRVPGLKFVHYDHGSAWNGQRRPSQVRYLRDLDGAISCSAANARMLREFWGYRGPLEVTLNALRPGARQALRPKPWAGGRRYRLGAAGRLAQVKGLPVLLHAVAQCRASGTDVELHLAGDGPARESLQALAARLGIAQEVHFHGLMSDVRAFYEQVDAICVPSLQESFPLACVEAAAAGCPVVAANVGGVVEIVRHGETGLCVPARMPLARYGELGGDPAPLAGWYTWLPDRDAIAELHVADPSDFAAALRQLIEVPGLAEDMSRAALAHAATHFHFDRYLSDMAAALTRLARP